MWPNMFEESSVVSVLLRPGTGALRRNTDTRVWGKFLNDYRETDW